jgi:hypothetical protein
MATTTAAQLSRIRKGRVLTQAEQDRACIYLGRGLSQEDTIRKLHISRATWQNTVAECPEFKQITESIYANRIKDVEIQGFKLALGASKTIKLTYVAQLDKSGHPVKDDDGKQVMLLSKREITLTPPDWRAVEFILRTRMPDTYSSKALAHDHAVESLDTIKSLLEGKMRERAKAALPPALNGVA